MLSRKTLVTIFVSTQSSLLIVLFSPAWPFISNFFGVSEIQAKSLVFYYTLAQMLGPLIGGVLTDFFSSRQVLLFFNGIFIVDLFLVFLGPFYDIDWISFFLLRFFQGIFSQTVLVVHRVFLKQRGDFEDQVKELSYMGFIQSGLQIFCPFGVDLLLAFFPWNAICVPIILSAIGAFVLLFCFPEMEFERKKRFSFRAFVDFSYPCSFWKYAFFLALSYFVTLLCFSFCPYFFEKSRLSLFFSVTSLGYFLGSFFVKKGMLFFGQKKLFWICGILLIFLGLFSCLQMSGFFIFWGLIFTQTVFAFLKGLFSPFLQSKALQNAGPLLGKASAVLNGLACIGSSAGAFMGAYCNQKCFFLALVLGMLLLGFFCLAESLKKEDEKLF